jgi:hypothetical protein
MVMQEYGERDRQLSEVQVGGHRLLCRDRPHVERPEAVGCRWRAR